jgi:hypothetical protein
MGLFVSSPKVQFISFLSISEWAMKSETAIGGELALCALDRATSLYSVGPWGQNHDAVLRIGSEAPWWRVLSLCRYENQSRSRSATTSDHQQLAVVKRWLPISS